MELLRDWFRRTFSDPQLILLAMLLAIGFGVVLLMGDMLAPVLASIVIAYLMEGVVRMMEQHKVKRFTAVLLVYCAFLAFVAFVLLFLVPLLWTQSIELVGELPNYIAKGHQKLSGLPEHYPFISEAQIDEVMRLIRAKVAEQGERLLSVSISTIPGVITVMIYLVLVPLLVFFFLKDKRRIVAWFLDFLPHERQLSSQVWSEVDVQLGNYVRGKFWEILIVGIATFIVFLVMDLKYAMLLSVLVGLSVLVPYIGAAVVTIPVALIAYFQWGWGSDFAWLLVAYGIIQALDGNVLVPLLFSEVVNLHPVAIIVAVLVFGGLWGFWGIFFAIPLATLVNAILRAWPTAPNGGEGEAPA